MTKRYHSPTDTHLSRRHHRCTFESLEPRLALAIDLGYAAAFQTLGPSDDSLFSGQSDRTGGGVVIDAAGNQYVTINGGSDQSVDLDPGPAASAAMLDAALIKLDANGALVWKAALNATGTSTSPVVRINHAVDADQNVYMVGDFRGPVDFDPFTSRS
jgi:hypothetical protein